MRVIHLPNDSELRRTTSYHQVFALTLFWNIGLLGLIILFLFIICYLVKKHHLKNHSHSQNPLKQSLISQQSQRQTQSVKQSKDIISKSIHSIQNISLKNPSTKTFKLINFLTSLFFYLFWIDIASVYLGFYIFGYMGRGLPRDVLTILIMILIVFIPTFIWKNITKINLILNNKKQLIFTILSLLLWTAVAWFSVITFKGACLCYYNDHYGFSVSSQSGPFFSSQWMRSNKIQKICKDKQVCNIYATVPLNTNSQVFINMHTGLDLQNLTVRLFNNTKLFEKNTIYDFKLDTVEQIGQRLIHTAYFKGLQQNTLYTLEVYKRVQGNKIQSNPLLVSAYKTTPNKESNKLKLAIGGDVSMTQQTIKLTQNLVDFDPDIIIIGGDNSYDDGMRTCWYSWDNFYDIFDDLNKRLKRLVPIIMSVGNHDVGFDSLSNVNIDFSQQEIPYYFLYNPQHLNQQGKYPKLSQRLTTHAHIIGPTIHLHLDSGYVKSIQNQSHLIQQIGQKYKGYYLFANYHNPIYPSCANYQQGSNGYYFVRNASEYWVPYFDKYNYTACFEHHTHHKKFTKKLINGTPTNNSLGVRYVGDGSWGVREQSCPSQLISPQDIFEFYDSKQPNHIWLVTITKQEEKNYYINYTAIDINGKVKNNQTVKQMMYIT